MKLRYQKLTGGYSPVYEVWVEGDTSGRSIGTVERPANLWIATAKGKRYFGQTREIAARQLPGADK